MSRLVRVRAYDLARCDVDLGDSREADVWAHSYSGNPTNSIVL
jgi:hypothetical protein